MFKPGDTVSLNSGGPVMTVETVTETKATCSYFSRGEDLPHTVTFPVVCLGKATIPNLWKKTA